MPGWDLYSPLWLFYEKLGLGQGQLCCLGAHIYRDTVSNGKWEGAPTPDKGTGLRDGEFHRVFKHLAKVLTSNKKAYGPNAALLQTLIQAVVSQGKYFVRLISLIGPCHLVKKEERNAPDKGTGSVQVVFCCCSSAVCWLASVEHMYPSQPCPPSAQGTTTTIITSLSVHTPQPLWHRFGVAPACMLWAAMGASPPSLLLRVSGSQRCSSL